MEEFSKYQSIPQIKQLTDRWVWLPWSHDRSHDVNVNNLRLESVQYDLAQQIRVDFEKSFSVKGAPVRDRGREGEGERERGEEMRWDV